MEARRVVAVVATLSKGYDLDYIWLAGRAAPGGAGGRRVLFGGLVLVDAEGWEGGSVELPDGRPARRERTREPDATQPPFALYRRPGYRPG
jgi:hypothetical protein